MKEQNNAAVTSCINCAENNNVFEDKTTRIERSLKCHRLHNNQRFSTVMSLRRTCLVCTKKIYFKSLKCNLCNSIAHRRCLNENNRAPCDVIDYANHVAGCNQLTVTTANKAASNVEPEVWCERAHSNYHRRFYNRLMHWISKRVKSPAGNKDCQGTNVIPYDACAISVATLKMHVHSTAFLNHAQTTTLTHSSDDDIFQPANIDMSGNLSSGKFGCSVKKSRTMSVESKGSDHESLCATWPISGRKVFNSQENLEGSESGFEDCDPEEDEEYLGDDVTPLTSSHIKDSMGEWSIPFQDIKMGRKVRTGRHHDIYRGQWHGDVNIHIFHINNTSESTQFWKDVSTMSMIRHENLALFMGVCIDMPQLAIVTSVRKARSLYDHIHVKREHCSLPTKVHIARQVAQGMSYLHAKGIVHRKLNSKNVVLENKVKVCLLDQGMAEQELDREGYGCLPNGHLTYISPEIMKSLVVQAPKLINTLTYSSESDIYAFGTVLYELFGERWPFQGQLSHSIIWQVGSGQVQSLDAVQCSSAFKNLINECWSREPSCRPAFNHILRVVQENVVIHRRHSSSEPENLNRLGFSASILK